ncbi:sperm flagellar protein 1-like [Amphiura filiformis]|uniref:sperm flagellar protein 1-like n=1 Tax=Amphiura filiformis TaxID=82378 RepID=UPI003B21C67E
MPAEKDKMSQLDEETLQELFAWVDEIPLSRPKKTITRDFSDGVMVAEVVHHFVPRLVEIHNYTPANSTIQKQSNWGTLNRKVLSKLNYNVPESVVRGITNSKPGVAEVFLWKLKQKIEAYIEKKGAPGAKISPDGYLSGQEVGSGHQQPAYTEKPPLRSERIQAGRPPLKAQPGPKVPVVHQTSTSNLHKTRSLNKLNDMGTETRLILEEKEQALLASNETVQILQAKVRRLEHLLHLKDIRIEELTKRVEQMGGKY